MPSDGDYSSYAFPGHYSPPPLEHGEFRGNLTELEVNPALLLIEGLLHRAHRLSAATG